MHDPSKETRLTELLDACRPDSDDLELAEMAPLRERLAQDPAWQTMLNSSQALDRQIRSVYREVPVPEELPVKLLEKLGIASAEGDPPAVRRPFDRPHTPSGRAWRQRSLVALGIAASLLLVVLLRHSPSGRTWYHSQQELLEQAVSWADRIKPEAWQPLGEPSSATADAASLPPRWAGLTTRWQSLSAGGRRVDCYQLPAPPPERALLFVLPAQAAPVSSRQPPALPSLSTHGRHVGAWTSDQFLFVLFVEGSTRTYQRLAGPGERIVQYRPELVAVASRSG